MFPRFTENFLPFHIHRRLRKERDGEWVRSYLAYIIDRDFEIIHQWNFELIAGMQIKYSPLVLGLAPFEAVKMLSDTRSLDRVAWSGGIEYNSDGAWMEKRLLAAPILFSDYCRKHALDLSEFNPPDPRVYEAVADWDCPVRRRTVIHAGCAYGAPLFLHVVEHRKSGKGNATLLDKMLQDANDEKPAPSNDLGHKHAELLRSLDGKLRIEYLAREEIALLNGKPFVKGLAARILKNLVQYHLQSGKTEFEYWEFKKNHEISGGGKPQNFEIRFIRLVRKLEEQGAGLRIEKVGRGGFKLHVEGNLEFSQRETFQGPNPS